MDYRNPVYTVDGRITCEIDHPHYGWIPFTADGNDVEALGVLVFDLITEQGDAAQYVPELPQVASSDPNDYTLTQAQWRHMARSAGLWDHIDTVKSQLKASDLSAWADIMETLEGSRFGFGATLLQIQSFQPMLEGVVLPSEAELTTLWIAAASR